MRLSELLRMEVVGADGTRLGRLRDLELVFRARQGSRPPELLVERVRTGTGAFAERFGYGRGPVKGPWLLRVVMERLRRHERTVDVDERIRIKDGRLIVGGSHGARPAAEEMP